MEQEKDIVERLRDQTLPPVECIGAMCRDAADEIERLREQVIKMGDTILALNDKWDEALGWARAGHERRGYSLLD